jgi:hypothetical protein
MVTTFAGLEALKGVYLPGTTRPVFRGRAKTLSGDFVRDVAHGLVTFEPSAEKDDPQGEP